MLNPGNIQQTLSVLLITLSLSHYAMAADKSAEELKHLVKHDCGSCHGMTLKGGLGPALQMKSLKHKPDELLFITIKEGRPGTPMPPWKNLLSDNDIHSIVKLLRNGLN